MSAPVRVEVPVGADADPLGPSLGWRLTDVDVALVRPGDFTVFTGFRMVAAVEVETETRGRGSKRATRITGYRLHRQNDTFDRLEPGTLVKVFAP